MAQDEPTAPVATPNFARRRFVARLLRFRALIVAVLLAVLLGTGGWLLYFSSVLTVRGVEVSGNSSLSAQRIEAVARAPLGTPLVRADLAAVQARVEAIPAVRSVSVSRSWPHTVHIAVTERTPVAVVSRGAGLQAVDDQGVLFGSYAKAPKDLPLIRTAPDVRAEVLAEAAGVVQSLRADIAARVRYVDVATLDEITLKLEGGVQVQWGSAGSSEEKARVLRALLPTKAHTIDVSVPGRPTTR